MISALLFTPPHQGNESVEYVRFTLVVGPEALDPREQQHGRWRSPNPSWTDRRPQKHGPLLSAICRNRLVRKYRFCASLGSDRQSWASGQVSSTFSGRRAKRNSATRWRETASWLSRRWARATARHSGSYLPCRTLRRRRNRFRCKRCYKK